MKFTPAGPPRYVHQRKALRRIIETRGVCALLCDPGTGKTAITLDYMSLLTLANAHQNQQEETRVLVLCPLVAVDTWVMQAADYVTPQIAYWAEVLGGSIKQKAEALADRGKGGLQHVNKAIALGARRAENDAPLGVVRSIREDLPGPRLVVEVVNLDALSRKDRVSSSKTLTDVMVNAIRAFSPDLIVVDESHRIKGVSSNVSRALARLSDHVSRRIILTGTVMPHSPLDVFAQWRFLAPMAFGSQGRRATFGGFKARYATLGGWMGQQVVGFRNLDEMQEIMSRNAIVVKKEDALDLPPTTDVTVGVNLSAKEAKAYAGMRDQLAAEIVPGVELTASIRLTQRLRLQQITSGHLPDDSGEIHTIGRSRVDTAKSLVHDTLTGEKRIVIFAYFTHEIEELAKGLAAKGTEVLQVTGGTPQKDRIAIRARFGSDDPARLVLVAQIGTMSLAVNELVTASHAIFASLSSKRDEYVQARDRLDRIGQTRPVTFWHLVAPGTVDEVILRAHRDRTNLETAILQHIKEGRSE